MTERNLRREMLEDLLVQRATEALDAAAETELATLLAEFPGTDALAYERAAAAVWLAAGSVRDAMPKALEERILAGARPAAPRP